MKPEPTGVIRDGNRIAFTRTFAATVEDVWASVTEPDRLARWYGTWTGHPSTGQISVTMTSEDDHAGDPVSIRVCDPPQRLGLTLTGGGEAWQLDLEVDDIGGGKSTLTLVQTFSEPDIIPMVGPGWDFYLDRLVAAETGSNVEAIDFDADYYPAMEEHYRALTERMRFS